MPSYDPVGPDLSRPLLVREPKLEEDLKSEIETEEVLVLDSVLGATTYSDSESYPKTNFPNPISVIRSNEVQSLRQFARKVKCNFQLLYLTEKGCYVTIPRSILCYCTEVLGYPSMPLQTSYEEFQRSQRETFGSFFRFAYLDNTACLGSLDRNPILAFREHLSLSRVAFCKGLCLPPSVLYKLENSLLRTLPYSVEVALDQALFPVELIGELAERVEEYGRRL
jgi:hypothetical protein